jgi:hypothetical protein
VSPINPLHEAQHKSICTLLWKGLEWIKLKYYTKVYPGNVQNIVPRLLLIACYIGGSFITGWLINEQVKNVNHAWENPQQSIHSEILDEFPEFDIHVCPVPRLKLWKHATADSYTHKFFNHGLTPASANFTVQHIASGATHAFGSHVAMDIDTSTAIIFSRGNGTGALDQEEVRAKPVTSKFQGFIHSCVRWELSKHSRLFERKFQSSLILNVNITGMNADNEVDLLIAPSFRGEEATFFGSSVMVAHPSIVALKATAKIYHHVSGNQTTQVTLGTESARLVELSDVAGDNHDRALYSQLQIHPYLGGFNEHCWVVRESISAVLSPAIASVLSTVTMIFGVFRYLFPRSPLVPVYFRWSTGRRFMELQASQSARRECNLPYPRYSDGMIRKSDLPRFSDISQIEQVIRQSSCADLKELQFSPVLSPNTKKFARKLSSLPETQQCAQTYDGYSDSQSVTSPLSICPSNRRQCMDMMFKATPSLENESTVQESAHSQTSGTNIDVDTESLVVESVDVAEVDVTISATDVVGTTVTDVVRMDAAASPPTSLHNMAGNCIVSERVKQLQRSMSAQQDLATATDAEVKILLCESQLLT